MKNLALWVALLVCVGCPTTPSNDDDVANDDDAANDDDSANDDDAANDDDSADQRTETRVFVSSTKHDGALGGLVGGDAVCQGLADAEDLGGTWMAWLGDGTDGPATRFVVSERPYVRVGGGVVAENFADLIDGTIAVPLNQDETGSPLPSDDDMIVWTAVFHTGGEPTPVNCSGWTAAEPTLVPTGLATATDTGWTVTAPYNCDELHRFYCFEQ
ncbi:MAG: hypothetical protein KDA24_03250 [Deltaproteobacteria bacterium]|nr:hypothetical protein [Deltaproteobacteria bacterium]